MPWRLSLLFLAACGPHATDLQIGSCGDDTDTGAEAGGSGTLFAGDLGGGEVEIIHQAVPLSCCVEKVKIDVRKTGTNLALAYTEKGDVCDCICPVDLTYHLKGVPTGNWGVNYGEAAAYVLVE